MNQWTPWCSTNTQPMCPWFNRDSLPPELACRANRRTPHKCCKTTKKSNKLHHRLRETYEKLKSLMKINWREMNKRTQGTSISQQRTILTTLQSHFQWRTSLQTIIHQPLRSRLHRSQPPRSPASWTWKKTQILTTPFLYTWNCITLT